MFAPPRDISELLDRAAQLGGRTVGELARRFGRRLPDDPTRAKGVVGELVEVALGASAGNLDLPDFPELGVELKTIPLDRAGRVRESTFVCAIDLAEAQRAEWARSRAWRKLRCVLWVPVESARTAPLDDRVIGEPLLWRPDREQEAVLRGDWLEIIGRIAVGGIEELTAHVGEALQVRPKAANSRVSVEGFGPDREVVATVPRGFYLRARFTEQVLWKLTDH